VKVKPIAMRNGLLIINRRDEIKDKDESHSLKRFLTRVFCGGQGASREREADSRKKFPLLRLNLPLTFDIGKLEKNNVNRPFFEETNVP